MSLVTACSRDGVPLQDLRVAPTYSWVLNGIGKAEFQIPVNDPKCTRENLEFGNLLWIRHETLPDWLGVIDKPRPWGNGVLTVTAYEIMQITKWRRTPENTTLTGTAGNIFEQLVAIANDREDTRIRAVYISGDGTERQEMLSDQVWTHINRVRKRAGNDIVVDVGLSAGKLVANATWRARAGDAPLQALVEGKNIELQATPLTEDGEFYNDLLALGDATTGNTRISANAVSETSRSQYGLREVRKVYDGISDQASLEATARAEVARNANPVKILSLTALEVGNTFTALRLGNTLAVQGVSVGFSGAGKGYTAAVRLYGMKYFSATRRVNLMIQESADGQF